MYFPLKFIVSKWPRLVAHQFQLNIRVRFISAEIWGSLDKPTGSFSTPTVLSCGMKCSMMEQWCGMFHYDKTNKICTPAKVKLIDKVDEVEKTCLTLTDGIWKETQLLEYRYNLTFTPKNFSNFICLNLIHALFGKFDVDNNSIGKVSSH